MTTMVERMARALCREMDLDPDVQEKGRPMWMFFTDHARAAIEALLSGLPERIRLEIEDHLGPSDAAD